MRKRRYRFYGSRVECCRRSTRGAAATWSGVGDRKVVKMTPKDTEKLLVVWGRKFTAGAVWERRDGVWKCKRAAPIVAWMLRVKHPSVVLDWLKAKGYGWEWR